MWCHQVREMLREGILSDAHLLAVVYSGSLPISLNDSHFFMRLDAHHIEAHLIEVYYLLAIDIA